MPRKFLSSLEVKREAAEALALTLERLGGRAASYAEVCRSTETDELLRAWEAEDPSAPRRLRELLDRSGIEPPDTGLLAWGSVMGPEEARVREQVATALEQAVEDGRLSPGTPGFRRRQAEIADAALHEPSDCDTAGSRLQAVRSERVERWVRRGNTRVSVERGAIIEPVAALIAAEPGSVDPDSARAALAPAVWLLEQATDGIALTQTGALNRALVREAAERWPHWWRADLFGPPNRQDDLALLCELNELLHHLRLIRRKGRQILATARGRKLQADPSALLLALARELLAGQMRSSLIRASLLAMIATAALAPAVASAGQIVFVRGTGGSSSETNLWVMNEDGSSQRMLLAPNQNGDGVSGLNQPNLLPTGVNLAFQGSSEAPGGGCGVNCVGVYTLVGGVVTRVSAPVVPCHTFVNTFCSLSDIDNGPTLTDDGRVLYLHTGAGVGVECGIFCGVYAATGNTYIIQPVLGGSPSQWSWPPAETVESPAEQGGYAASPVADPANPGLILYAGIEDNTCGSPDTCHPLVVDNASGESYIVSDDDARQYTYAWSPNGEYIADIEGGTEPGIWVYKNAKEPNATAWYAMQQPANSLGYSLSVTNAGNIIFSYEGDIYSLAPTCWGRPPAKVATEPEKPNCTLVNATQLTTGGADSDATWTESTQPIVVNAPVSTTSPGPTITPPSSAPAPPPTPVVSGVSQTNTTWREGNEQATFTRKHLSPIGTSFSFGLNEPASVELEFTQSLSGRKVGKSCVAQAKKNEHKHRCTRTVIAGTLTFFAHAGVNTVHFDGLVSAHKKLEPGIYTLLVTATASGKQSTPSSLHFTIANR